MNRFVSAAATGLVAVALSAGVVGVFAHAGGSTPTETPPASFDRQLDPARLAVAHAGAPVIQTPTGLYVGETAVVEAPTMLVHLQSQPLLGGSEQSVTGWQDDPQPAVVTPQEQPSVAPNPTMVYHEDPAPVRTVDDPIQEGSCTR